MKTRSRSLQLTGMLLLLLGAVAPECPAQNCVPPPPDIVGWWPGEGDPADIAGAHPGTASASVQYGVGKAGSAFSFNGTDGYVNTGLDVQPSAMPSTTWEAWVYPTALSGRRQILSCDNGGYDRSVSLEGAEFGVFTGSGVWRPVAAAANEWTHIAVVFTPDNIEFYANGVRFSWGNTPGVSVTGNTLQIGRNPGYGEYFPGLIDEVSVYSRALTEPEILALYQAGAAGKCRTADGESDLSVTVSGPGQEVYRLDPFTNVILVVNAGPDAAAFVSVTATLSSALDFVTADQAFSQNGKMVSFSLGPLNPAGSAVIRMVSKPNALGAITNSVTVTGNGVDLAPANNSASWVGVAGDSRVDALNGNWSHQNVALLNTPEAGLMLRAGDIDNLGFQWPAGFDPFSGNSTPSHSFPWAIDTNNAPGTDQIFVGTGYNGSPPRGRDGYTSSTSRPLNLPQAIVISNAFAGIQVNSAVIQMFVDDFQASVWGASYQVWLNGVRAMFLEQPINQLVQTGPIGRMITVQVPPEFLPLINQGEVALLIDDPVTGAGDGYAVDFVKLLLNPTSLAQTGTIQGTVRETLQNQPVAFAAVSAAGGFARTLTDAQGRYVLTNVPAGQVFVSAAKFGYAAQQVSRNLVANATETVDFQLAVVPLLRILAVENGQAVLRWPAPIANWILERAPALPVTGPAAWSDVTVDRTFVDGETQALVPATGQAAFFRLRQP